MCTAIFDVNSSCFFRGAVGHRCVLRMVWSGVALACAGSVQAAQEAAIVGKDNWLFVRYELVLEALDPQAQASFQLIEKLHRMLERRGVAWPWR